MTPYKTWKKNKGRVDLRQYTRDFQLNFRIKGKCQIEVGKVYAITYRTDSSIPTDKHHVTPVILSLGNYRGDDGYVYTRGINLLYLNTSHMMVTLDDAYKVVNYHVDKRVMPIIHLHDRYMRTFPYAFKNFQDLRILTAIEIEPEEWGMIGHLYKYLMGNFSAVGLNEDFQDEFTIKKKYMPPKDKKVKEEVEEQEQEQETIIEDMYNVDFDEDDLDVV